METLQHGFVDCPYAHTIWNFFAAQFGCSIDLIGSPLNLFKAALDIKSTDC